MKHKNNPNQITEIISISHNYLTHRKNLTKVRGLVDHSSHSRNQGISQLLKRKANYHQVVKGLQRNSLNRQNEKLISRIQRASKQKSSRVHTSLNSSRMMQKTMSEHSLLCSRTRRNFLKEKQISQQNERMQKRITNSRNKNRLGPNSYRKKQKETKQIKEVIGRYSVRNRQKMQSMLEYLDVDAKKVPFLPYIQRKSPKYKSFRFQR